MRHFIRSFFKRDKSSGSRHALRIPNLPGKLSMEVHEANDMHISRSIEDRGIWEPDETQFIVDALSPGDTFVDVGANIGYFTLIGSKLVGDSGKVFAFEPDRDNYGLLAANCEFNQCANVELHEAALSNETTQGELFLSESNMGDHTIYPLESGRSSTTISLVNGSDLFLSKGERINVLKIDTQGSEYQVVQGLSAILEHSLPDLIMLVEFSPNSVIKTGVSGLEFLDLFSTFDGAFYIFDSQHGGIIPISARHLEQWTKLTEMDSASEGFINLIFSGIPLETNPRFEVVSDLGLFDNALEYLLRESLQSWNGSLCSARAMSSWLYFASGWSFFEDWGVWSEGNISSIKCRVSTAGLKPDQSLQLVVTGRYFGSDEQTDVLINRISVGAHDLRHAAIPLPEACDSTEYLSITFHHRQPLRPSDVSASNDNREIQFGIESIAILPRTA